MNTTIGFLNAVIAKTGAPSDYAVAKILGLTTQTVSVWRVGKGTMSNEVGLKVAQILELDEQMVLAALQAERAKSEKEKAVWKALFEKLGGIAASVTLGIMLNQSYPTEASAGAAHQSVNNKSDLYIMRSKKRRKRRFNPLEMMVSQILSLA